MTKISRRRHDKSTTRLVRSMKMIMGTAVVVYICYRWYRTPKTIVLPPTKKEIQLAIGNWFSGIDGNDDVPDCDMVGENVETGKLIDPNQGYAYLRQSKDKPQFYVSLHNNEHDIARWEEIFKKGDGYEQRTRKNMEYILSETNAHWKSVDYTLPVVVDVGANVGYYTFLAAAWKHAVVAFEIDPIHMIRLCESLRFNRGPMHVRIHRLGASTTTGTTLDIEVPDEQPSDDDASGRTFSVSTITLDDFATERNWFERDDLHVALLKVDTGGHEQQVLQGAQKIIKHQLAKNLILDFFGGTCRDAATMLLDAGYVVVDDAIHNRRMLSRQESEVIVDTFSANNYVANLWFRLSHLPLT